MFDDLMQKLDKIEPLLEIVGDKELITGAHFLADRIANPNSYVTMLGETSSGKSTLINGLIGKKMLSVKASPTTGAITEIELYDNKEDYFYSINKDSTFEQITFDKFTKLTECPDDNVSRVKLRTYYPNNSLKNMRIFDTPGYDSIVEQHEEILKEFLPNSDVIIYVVSYKIGIQEEDYNFLGFLNELIRENAEIVLVINFCPPDITTTNKRISEIKKYIKSILHKEPKTFLVPFIRVENENEYPMPKAEELWKYVSQLVNSEEHINELHSAFESYIYSLYKSCDAKISMRYAQACMDYNANKELNEKEKEYAKKIRNAINEKIEPAFESMENRLPELFSRAKDNVIKYVLEKIDESDTARMDEMIAYVNYHCLPYKIKQEGNEIKSYLEIKLEKLNKEVNDYINKEIQDFSNEISIRLNTCTDIAIKNVYEKLTSSIATNLLKNTFMAFGGAGGANAGIANAASHMLKKIGDLFGKTFSRETHNALKSFLAKIGATSMKKISGAITVIVEVLSLAVDYATWKSKLKNKVKDGINKWKDESLDSCLKDLKKLKEENIKNINEIADAIENSFSEDSDFDQEKLNEAVQLSKTIGKEIGVD